MTGLGSRAAVGSDRATPEAAVAWPQRYRAASDARGGSQILMIYVSYSVAVSFMNFLDFFDISALKTSVSMQRLYIQRCSQSFSERNNTSRIMKQRNFVASEARHTHWREQGIIILLKRHGSGPNNGLLPASLWIRTGPSSTCLVKLVMH